MNKTVGIVGLGLLGASLAKGLKGTEYTLLGYARRQEVCDAAVADGAVSAAYTDVRTLVEASDILVFALPPDTNAAVFLDILPYLKPGCLVTDVSSTKQVFVSTVYEHLPKGVHFVSLHPMAGSEKGGYEMARADLFNRATWIVLEDEQAPGWSAEGADELEAMGHKLGARIERIPMVEHDRLLAYVSHGPHALAATMSYVVGDDRTRNLRLRLAAGGLRDVTRVAGGNPAMWKQIIRGNKDNVVEVLEAIKIELTKVQEAILADDDGRALEDFLGKAKEVRDELSTIA